MWVGTCFWKFLHVLTCVPHLNNEIRGVVRELEYYQCGQAFVSGKVSACPRLCSAQYIQLL